MSEKFWNWMKKPQRNVSELFQFCSKGETYIRVYTKYFIFRFSICQIALLNFCIDTISDDEFMLISTN